MSQKSACWALGRMVHYGTVSFEAARVQLSLSFWFFFLPFNGCLLGRLQKGEDMLWAQHSADKGLKCNFGSCNWSAPCQDGGWRLITYLGFLSFIVICINQEIVLTGRIQLFPIKQKELDPHPCGSCLKWRFTQLSNDFNNFGFLKSSFKPAGDI